MSTEYVRVSAADLLRKTLAGTATPDDLTPDIAKFLADEIKKITGASSVSEALNSPSLLAKAAGPTGTVNGN